VSGNKGKTKFTLLRQTVDSAGFTFPKEVAEAYSLTTTPLVVIGGAGTGKTSLLVEAALVRIAAGQDPNSILLLTYGRESASDLRDAIALRTTQTMFEPLARTFHSLAFSILKKRPNAQDLEPILFSGPEQEKFIKELLAGDVLDGNREWNPELHAALSTSGFARELRDLILRANERKFGPGKLAELGNSSDEPFWEAAGKFWERYIENLSMQEDSAGDSKQRLDTSEIVSSAARRLKERPDILEELRSQFTTIMVDEYQESDPQQRELLRILACDDMILCADDLSTVGRFRGADPEGLAQELDHYRSKGRSLALDINYRNSPEIMRLSNAFATEKFSTSANNKRVIAPAIAQVNEVVQTHRLRSSSEEAAFIAHQFRSAHLNHGIAYSDMAVLFRSPGVAASSLRRAFAQVGIPVTSELEALAGNPSIAPFLLLAEVAIGSKYLSLDICERLLMSEFGGADSISLRRMRRALLNAREEGDARTGTQLMIDAIDKGDIFIEEGAPLKRVSDLLRKARAIAKKPESRAEDLLWAIWDNALTSEDEKVSDAWRNQALRPSIRGAAADRDLDAMMQLFDSAARYSERFPMSGAGAFIKEIVQEDIAGDVITAKGARPDFVEILTVHSSKGRQWKIVAIAGVQDGVWPNLRQRSSLLGSERLVEMVRYPNIPKGELERISANGLRDDENRLFLVAMTRAQTHLYITAIQREDDAPSDLFESAEQILQGKSAKPLLTEVPRPITVPALVSALRAQLSGDKKKEAAALLKKLSDEGIHVANPQNWVGAVERSSDLPVVDPKELVSVSPSALDTYKECALKWFLQSNGGTNGDSTAQILGSAIHAFAAKLHTDPTKNETDLLDLLKSSWKLIDPDEGWVGKTSLEEASKMISRFVHYHAVSPRKVVAVETSFTVEIGRARLHGNADRIEIDLDNNLYIVDFKTGNTMIPANTSNENMQLAAYQLGAIKGGFSQVTESTVTNGAELAYLAAPAAKEPKITTRKQGTIDSEVFVVEIESIAQGMGAATFIATVNEKCKGCPVRSSCPIQSDGKSVIE
jgi:superfamily I DNA/RNA helicase/RecB family exonuclease